MNKKKVAMATCLVIVVASIGIFSVIRSSATIPVLQHFSPSLFTYTAKWICNTPSAQPGSNGTVVNTGAAESIGLVPGEYKTDINVHNPGPANDTIVKKFVVSVPESTFLPNANLTAFTKTFAGPDVAFFITCDEIQELLRLPPLHAFKGFIILQTRLPNLDVVAEYSSEAFDFSPECPFPSFQPLASSNCPEGLTLDVQKIAAVPVTTPITVCSQSSTITASPSVLTVQKGFNGTSTIVITNSPCTLITPIITECFTVAFTPGVAGGPTGSIIPSCVTVVPGGTASATLFIFVPSTAPSAPYSLTVTATCGSCTPPLVQTVSIGLIVP